MAFYQALTVFERILFIFASAATFLLVVQVIFLLIGIGHSGDADFDSDIHTYFDGDVHTDFDGNIHTDFEGEIHADLHADSGNDVHSELSEGTGLAIFTVKGLIAFFAVGGWAGLVASQAGAHIVLVIFVCLGAGFLAMYGVAFLFKLGFKMQDDGTIRIHQAIGQIGKVYLTVPPKGNGMGKVNLTLNERHVELDAITESNEPIKTDELVRIMGCYENTIIVERINGK